MWVCPETGFQNMSNLKGRWSHTESKIEAIIKSGTKARITEEPVKRSTERKKRQTGDKRKLIIIEMKS